MHSMAKSKQTLKARGRDLAHRAEEDPALLPGMLVRARRPLPGLRK